VPGYDRTVPPGHFATGSSFVLTFGIKVSNLNSEREYEAGACFSAIDVVISDALCPDVGQAPQPHEGFILKERTCHGWHES
jgi:hypothetical protein